MYYLYGTISISSDINSMIAIIFNIPCVIKREIERGRGSTDGRNGVRNKIDKNDRRL